LRAVDNGANGGNSTTKTFSGSVAAVSTLTYHFDNNGNTDSDPSRTVSWDVEDRAYQITQLGKVITIYYDAFSRWSRVKEESGGVVVSDQRFVWLGDRLIGAVDAAGTVTKRYFAEGYQDGTQKFLYYFDLMGNVREVRDVGGASRAVYDYGLFGKRTLVSGNVDSDLGFGGLHKLPDTGLWIANYRIYDPTLGRWLSRDPIGEAGGMNLYGYVGNNPVNNIDPLGLSPELFPDDALMITPQGFMNLVSGVIGFVDWLSDQSGLTGLLGAQPSEIPMALGPGLARMPGGLASCEARSGAQATRLARQLGKQGEAAAGIMGPKVRIPSLSGTANYRIPDALSTTTLTEVKNVAELRITDQIRDFTVFAQQNQLLFNIVTRQNATIAPSAQQFVQANRINIVRLLPRR
jgi:RHS repeat-associated protein